jgi:hypothetical protein
MRIVRAALEAICTPVTGPTLFDPLEHTEREVSHVS